jgi:hypothetical protein
MRLAIGAILDARPPAVVVCAFVLLAPGLARGREARAANLVEVPLASVAVAIRGSLQDGFVTVHVETSVVFAVYALATMRLRASTIVAASASIAVLSSLSTARRAIRVRTFVLLAEPRVRLRPLRARCGRPLTGVSPAEVVAARLPYLRTAIGVTGVLLASVGTRDIHAETSAIGHLADVDFAPVSVSFATSSAACSAAHVSLTVRGPYFEYILASTRLAFMLATCPAICCHVVVKFSTLLTFLIAGVKLD